MLTVSLVLTVPPEWEIEPQDASVVGGQDLRIDCLAGGFPSPVITWERGSPSSLTSGRMYSVISSGPHFEVYVNGSLLIKNTGEDDSGFYLCQASNSIGPGLSKVITLEVHGESNLHDIFSPFLDCHVSAFSCMFSSSIFVKRSKMKGKQECSSHSPFFDVLIHLWLNMSC